MDEDTTRNFTAANRAAWNASAPLHGTGEHWEGLLAGAARPGFSVLDPHLTATLERLDLKGKSAVQIGCNNARELLSLASLGIEPAMGIDQSAAFLAQAWQLAAAAGLEPRLVEADIYDLPAGLGTFDLALVTIGVLNWMPDLPLFFRVVAGLLAPGGSLVVYETHPFLEIFDPAGEAPHEPAFSYFERRPHEVTGAISYDGQDHGRARPATGSSIPSARSSRPASGPASPSSSCRNSPTRSANRNTTSTRAAPPRSP